MAKPLKESFFSRVYRLFYGMVFYNTIYWRRASDGLQPTKLSRDERLQNRPVRDLAKIRPRANPRARIEAVENGTPDVSVPLIIGSAPRLVNVDAVPEERVPAQPAIPTPDVRELTRFKKKKRRKLRQHSPRGILGRLFGRYDI